MTVPPDVCDPNWRDQPPDGTPPPPGLCRLQELHDLQDQHAAPSALRCAHTIPTQEYL